MISPLRYPGGKAKLYTYFVELIRMNNFYNCTYSEPYAGGAGLALKLLSHGYVSRIEINDIDPAIAAFWRSVVNEADRFCDAIEETEISVSEWRKQREIYKGGLSKDQFELGFSAYYLNRTSRSGIIEGSGPIGGYAQNGNWKIDARFNKTAQVHQVREIASFSSAISISNLDALEFCGSRINCSKRLTYLDPPYYVKGSKLYKNFYRHQDHKDIANFLRLNRDGNWILSYDCADPILSLYDSFDPIIYELPYSAGPSATGNEVIFTGSSIVVPSSQFLPRAA